MSLLPVNEFYGAMPPAATPTAVYCSNFDVNHRSILQPWPGSLINTTDVYMCRLNRVVRARAETGSAVGLSHGHDDLRPGRAWNGYTVLSPLATQAVLVIDMNGNVVKRWDGFNNSAGGPARVLPGGVVIAASGARPPHQESLELVQRDFAGNVLWRFSRNEQIKTRDGSDDLVGAPASRLAAGGAFRPATTRRRARLRSRAATR